MAAGRTQRVDFITRIRGFLRFLHREHLDRLLLALAVMIVGGTVAISYLEPNLNLLSGLWWTIVTMSTVGYGDISPSTLGGRIVAIFVMFFGIGLVGMLSATIASVLVERKLREDRGLSSSKHTNHIVICGWNHRARIVLRELRADPEVGDARVVVIANLDQKPVDDDSLLFIQGEADDEALKRANLAQAQTVIILGDENLDPVARDAKVVLTTLTVEAINRDAYTIVELVSARNASHCKRANANEIIVNDDVSSGLLARAALDHGITQVFSELLSSASGDEIYKVPTPPSLVGKPFLEALTTLKQKHACLALAVQRGHDGEVISNPAADYRLVDGDLLVVIAAERPRDLA
jgi:voltage-gated potassium channel